MPTSRTLSRDKRRNEIYRSFLAMARRSPATVRDVYRLGNSLLGKAGVCSFQGMGTPQMDAKYLTYFGFGLQDYERTHLGARVTEPELLDVLRLFEERIVRRVPVQYVTHEAYYCGWYFYVDENVLVPRTMMGGYFDKLLSQVDWKNERVLDLCAGSGCIGITLAMKRPTLKVDLADISDGALNVCRKNIEKFNLGKRVRAIKSDLFSAVEGPYSLIISNPPYVDTEEWSTLPPEYKNEPRLALDAGPEGIDYAVPILQQAPRFLTPTGTLMVEVGTKAPPILNRKFPNIPFSWWRDEGTPPNTLSTGVFSLRNGYPAPAEKEGR